MKKVFSTTSIILIFTLCSCSLKYTETPVVDDIIPEFVFENTTLTSYEKNKKVSLVQADVLEQYKNSSESYAKGLKFTSYGKNGDVTSEGKCGYLFADSDRETYQLYDDIVLTNYEDDLVVHANALKWDGRTEQLTSGKSDTVKIEKDKTVIHGSGFSASGVSRTYRFTGAVSGDISENESREVTE